MEYTTNYNLAKPSGSDSADIGVINDNMDKLDAALAAHAARNDNPHSVTKAQVGLGNVENKAINNQTPTFTEASTLANISGSAQDAETISTIFGKVKKAISTLISHLSNTSNPHSVTAVQVGLGNVPNVTTNNQEPTYNPAGAITELSSGEKLSVAFGKIATAINTLMQHMAATNPHNVNATQVGLGNVDNVSTDDQMPSFSEAGTFSNINTGEKMSVLMGKIKKAISTLTSHINNNSVHGYYKAGDRIWLEGAILSGIITNGGTDIHLQLFAWKSFEKVSNISVTTLNASLIGVKGYIEDTSSIYTSIISLEGVTVSAVKCGTSSLDGANGENLLRIKLHKSTAFTNITNNTPVSTNISCVVININS